MGNASCDVHRVDKAEPFLDTALRDESLDSVGDIDEASPAGNFEPEMLGERFHFRVDSKRVSVAREVNEPALEVSVD